MKLGIVGTRGIPNHHGGFEQFAEYFSVYAAKQGHEVYVYNSSLHPYKDKMYDGVHILHVKDYENTIGTAGQFFYDLNAILDARKRKFDVILQLGYTSNAIWKWFLPKKAVIVTNMDGLEWQRAKYSKYVQWYLKQAERWAVQSSDFLISDSIGIQKYIKNKYHQDSEYIAYGASPMNDYNKNTLLAYDVVPYSYFMLIARIEPENNIETILDGYQKSARKYPFIVVGDATKNSFGRYLLDKYSDDDSIRFLGAIYDQNHLNDLRRYAHFYFHGHSVGGTNPSLLEAMASQSCIIAHDNLFNKSILKKNAYYFKNVEDVSLILDNYPRNEVFVKKNFQEIQDNFQWAQINKHYISFLKKCLDAKKTD